MLKITEEPLESSLIILICEDKETLLPTLNSRFQKIYFGRLKDNEIEILLSKFIKNQNEIKKIISIVNGIPGLALDFLNNEKFKKYLEDAKIFLKLKGQEKINFVKKFFDSENEIDIDKFLEILMFLIYNLEKKSDKRNILIWRKLFEMRRDFKFYNLNPKIHFLSLANILK